MFLGEASLQSLALQDSRSSLGTWLGSQARHEFLDALAARPFPFALESGLTGHPLSRNCFYGAEPRWVFQLQGLRFSVYEPGRTRKGSGEPVRLLRQALSSIPRHRAGESGPFHCGAVCYFGYDLGRFFEPAAFRGSPWPRQSDPFPLWDAHIAFYERVLCRPDGDPPEAVSDVGSGSIQQAGFAREAPGWFSVELGRPSESLDKLGTPRASKLALPVRLPGNPWRGLRQRWTSSMDRGDFVRAVRKAKQYIAEGEIYQVNVSQRFVCRSFLGPIEIHRRLARLSPCPYGIFLGLGAVSVIGSSPELFLRVRGDCVETRPIKGTRPRDPRARTDRALARNLLGHPKDRAELAMIVDLERNDLGKICRPGTVQVVEEARVESFPNVHHLVAVVRGQLRRRTDAVDLLRATFPGGSITGAPKIRAMQIIRELEPVSRGLFTGAFGTISCSGEIELAMAIRTAVLYGSRGFFQVGSGIVADSDPDREYEETLWKGSGLARAFEPPSRQ